METKSKGDSMNPVTSKPTYKNMRSVPTSRPLLPSLCVRRSIDHEKLQPSESSVDEPQFPSCRIPVARVAIYIPLLDAE